MTSILICMIIITSILTFKLLHQINNKTAQIIPITKVIVALKIKFKLIASELYK